MAVDGLLDGGNGRRSSSPCSRSTSSVPSSSTSTRKFGDSITPAIQARARAASLQSRDNAERVKSAVDANWEHEVEFLRGLVSAAARSATRRPCSASWRPSSPSWASTSTSGTSTRARDRPAAGLRAGRVVVRGTPERRVRAGRRGDGGRSLVFQGHIDVVPATPEHHWTRDPWARRGRRRPDVGPRGRGHEGGRRRHGLRRARPARRRRAAPRRPQPRHGDRGGVHRQRRARRPRPRYTADAAVIPEPFGHRALEAQVGVPWARSRCGARARTPSARPGPERGRQGGARDRGRGSRSRRPPTASELRRPSVRGRAHPLNYNVGNRPRRRLGLDRARGVRARGPARQPIPGEHLRDVQARFRSRADRRLRDDPWLAEHRPR